LFPDHHEISSFFSFMFFCHGALPHHRSRNNGINWP
jgi:hypothetical protein